MEDIKSVFEDTKKEINLVLDILEQRLKNLI